MGAQTVLFMKQLTKYHETIYVAWQDVQKHEQTAGDARKQNQVLMS